MWLSWALLALTGVCLGQQVFIPTKGPTARPQCTKTQGEKPNYTFKPFSYTDTDTVRYATPVPSPTTTQTYAAPSESLTSLLTSATYTTWGKWNPGGFPPLSDLFKPYGKAAWTDLWKHANPPQFTEKAVYSTTVSPTPVPSAELILPPRDYFGPQDCYNFPPGFLFGVSSSATQIEGATADEGKAPSVMDVVIQDNRPKTYVTNENYYYYKQDIERLAAMGVKAYSFSISWSRILPFAYPGTPINQQAIDHYDDLIDFVISKGMTPIVTLFHFDTPLQFLGDNLLLSLLQAPRGFVNAGYQHEKWEDSFVNYAKIVMTHYADRVPIWLTVNEPLLFCFNGKALDHVLKGHARVYHFYKEELKGKGKISLRLNDNFAVPKDPKSKSDLFAAKHFNDYQLGTLANPIYLGKDYPDALKQTITDYVPLTAKDLAYINGTADFFATNFYMATVVTAPTEGDSNSIAKCSADKNNALRPYCVSGTQQNKFGWNIGYRSQTYAYTTPTFLRSYLNYVWNTWRHPIMVTEFGFPVYGETRKDLPDKLFDSPRSNYYLSSLSEVLKAIWEDGVDVIGALAWSFLDTWEFGDDAAFGLQTVNKTTQERRYKKSFFDIVDFVRARGA
ncbi:family 1 glycoside hydrolase [Sarocladium strictum]